MRLLKRTADEIAEEAQARLGLERPQQVLLPDSVDYVRFADDVVQGVARTLTSFFRRDYNSTEALEAVKVNLDETVSNEDAYYRWIATSVGTQTRIRDRVSMLMRRKLTQNDGEFFVLDSEPSRALRSVLLALADRLDMDLGAGGQVDSLKTLAGITQADSLFQDPMAVGLRFVDDRVLSLIMNTLADVLEPVQHRPTEEHYTGFTNGLAITPDELRLVQAIEERSERDLTWQVVHDHLDDGLNRPRADATYAAVIAMMRSFGCTDSFKA
jgi:hypothetical protein